MDRVEAVQLLKATRAALEEGERIPPRAARWLRDGIRHYARGARTLDEALGLAVGPGQAHQRAVRLMEQAEREEFILDAANHLDGGISARATILAEAVRGFGHHGAEDLPEAAGLAIARGIMRHGDKLPYSRSHIMRILQGDTTPQRLGFARIMLSI